MRNHDGTTKDLTGQVFGLVTVSARAPSDAFGRVYWKCTCRCGSSLTKAAINLREGRFITCGKPECRFWEKVYIPESDSCWEWTGALNDQGYGVFRIGGKNVRAHVFSWTLKHGPVPVGLVIRHKVCDFRACVREDHLLPGTHQDNMDDMVEKGRSHVDRSPLSLVVKELIRADAARGFTYLGLVEKYGVSYSTVERTLQNPRGTTRKD